MRAVASELPLSKLAVAGLVVGLVAGAVGFAGYQDAARARDDVGRLRSTVTDPANKAPVEALQGDVARLTARVAELERSLRAAQPAPGTVAVAAAPGAAPGSAPGAAPPASSGSIVDALSPAAEKLQVRQAQARSIVTEHWKKWGAEHGLTPKQTDQLASMQADASQHKLDNQAKMMEGTMRKGDVKADNASVTEDVRRKAKALLSNEQFAQFEADKGAEWGSSYRRVRDTKSPGAPPAPPAPAPAP
jgi:hypothetical protein